MEKKYAYEFKNKGFEKLHSLVETLRDSIQYNRNWRKLNKLSSLITNFDIYNVRNEDYQKLNMAFSAIGAEVGEKIIDIEIAKSRFFAFFNFLEIEKLRKERKELVLIHNMFGQVKDFVDGQE